ncbi:pumilio-like protein 23 [Chlorella sorokiniana]|uniref:Pumilio-like protein 23 n=1 Tax=Chlorella sorokiniana TaxID=3076 RepID=A0A2P6TD93_CHLSO|nr:pumilio-like protein 23 [Chlorella sorokiniana]|eukprot:PRW20602.1 pumilio-like protein 23 [Chlorella sorokiniana]
MAGKKREREGEEAAPGGGGERKQRGYSRLDAETASYYGEIGGRFAELDDDEERTLLADNALGECVERGAADVGTDAACSRVLEKLLPHASSESLCAFTQACVEGDNLGTMCTSGPFGSHVLEKCIVELGKRAAAAGDDDFARIEAALTAVTDACAASLYEMATSKYGSFVARRLLCVLAGRDVAPPPGKKPAAQPEPAGEAGQAATPAGARGGGALAAKLGSNGGQGGDGGSGAAQGADYPALLEKLAATVMGDDWSGEEMQRLVSDSFAGPFLQAVLRACTHNQKLQQRLLLQVLGGAPSKGVESVSMERCHALLQDRNGSHLMEVVFSTAPDDYFAKLTTLCFKGHLLQLAQHPAANFGVQAALAALRKPQQLKRMFEDLKPAFPQLLRSRRSGVIAALLAAAGRLGAQEAEAAAALWSAASSGAAASPLAALLTLDTTTQLGQGSGRLSTLGCAMAATLLRLPGEACKQWAEAVAALPPGQLQHVAKDPGGCRVLEAYLEGPGSAAKKRRALLRGLAGAWGDIALGGSGSHFVEKAYALAEVAEKETIAGELAAAEPRLLQTHRGPVLLKRCHVDAFKKGSDGWQKRVAAADAARREFEDLFGDDAAAEQGEEQEAGGAAEGAAAAEGAGAAAEQQQPKKKKKKGKKAAAAAEADEEPQQQQGAEEQQAAGGKKKKRSKAEAAEAPAAAAAAEQQPAAKKPKKKKQKGSAE